MSRNITRLAPSPTGALHLGNARTFLINYLLARTRRWRVLMRVEDLDGPRIKPGATAGALEDLRWLGLQWEEPIVYQSDRLGVYQAALQKLIDDNLAYPCTCSRKDIAQAASAPHRDEAAGAYPGTCRERWSCPDEAERSTGRPVAWRVKVADEPIDFVDRIPGRQCFDLSETCGDFVIFRNEGLAGYQLAVVLDDAEAGVNRIVRGDDLLESTARQIHLRRLLGLAGESDGLEYWHLPLVVGPDGRRLAKRHGDTRLAHYRRNGTSPRRVLGLLAYWSGLIDKRREAEMDELVADFDPDRVPRRQVVMTDQDDAFLRGA